MIPQKKSSVSGETGAAAVTLNTAWSRPIFLRMVVYTSFSNTARFALRPNGTGLPCRSSAAARFPVSIAACPIFRLRSFGSSSSAARMPAWSFSHTRGTPANAKGRTSGIISKTWSTSGQK